MWKGDNPASINRLPPLRVQVKKQQSVYIISQYLEYDSYSVSDVTTLTATVDTNKLNLVIFN